MSIAIVGLYALFALVALGNLVLMRRPRPAPGVARFRVLIPARNERDNLARLIPSLTGPNPGLEVWVFDDESDDGTGEIAESLGARVLKPQAPLPEGWTGKNRACHELGIASAQTPGADWQVFLDADVYPSPDFIASLQGVVAGRAEVYTAFPHILEGEGVQALFLAWVGWILLCTNPFGLVARTGRGHNLFTNGQITIWRPETYARLRPNEQVRGAVLEDVKIGRLLGRARVRVEVVNLSETFAVKMYNDWRETLNGMSKNSHEIAPSHLAGLIFGLFLAFLALGWALAGPLAGYALGALVLSAVFSSLIVRARLGWALLAPIALLIGGYTVWRSIYLRRTGRTEWKGRTYAHPK